MNALRYLLTFPWVQPLGWTLVHFLWQGALIGLLAAVVLRATRRASSQVRYILACAFLALCVATPTITFILSARPPLIFGSEPRILGNAPSQDTRSLLPIDLPVPTHANKTSPGKDITENTRSPQAEKTAARSYPSSMISSELMLDEVVRWFVPLWLVGIMMMAIRLGTGWTRIQLWRFTAKPLADAGVLDLVSRLGVEMGLANQIRLLISDRITVPLTLGWLKPVILLPAQVVTGLSAQELEAVLAHEIAHIARYDYLINLLQSAIEVVLFYHPAVWWLSRQIRDIREECCDEAALRLGANRLVYAKALANLAELQIESQVALAATGGSLLNRIARLLGRPRQEPPWSRSHAAWALSLAGAFLMAVAILYSARLMANPDITIANTKPAPSGQVIDTSGAPLSGANVLLYYRRSIWGLGNSIVEKIVTDAKGHFTFTHPLTFFSPNGTDRTDNYWIVATRDGFAPAWTQVVGGSPLVHEYKLQLTAPVKQTFEVVDLKGKPVEGATLWLRAAYEQLDKEPHFSENLFLPENLGFCQAVTDSAGRATISNLPGTNRSVVASKEGFEDESFCTTPADGIPHFTLKPDATLEGRVTDPLGRPIEGVTVWVYPKFRWHQYFMAKTDRDGHYRIDKIWSNGNDKDWGKYDVGIRDSRFTAAKRDVAFTSGQAITAFDFHAEPGVQIVGKLIDPGTQQPVAGGEVDVDSDAGRQVMTSDAEGSFRCRVPAGMVYVFFSLPPGGTYAVDDRSRGVQTTLRTQAFGTEFPVTLNTPSTLGRLGAVRGKVIDAAGTPSAHAKVIATMSGRPEDRILTNGWAGNTFRAVRTDKDGNFIYMLPVGRDANFNVQSNAGDQNASVTFKIASDPFDLPEPITLQTSASADVTIVDLAGQPRSNFSVQVVPMTKDMDIWTARKDAKTDAHGLLHLAQINPGLRYRITDNGSNYAWAIFDPKSAIGSAQPPQVTITDRYILRALDSDKKPLRIKSVREFNVMIFYEGERTQWTNTPPTLGEWGDEPTIDRKTLALGKPGDEITLYLITDDGRIVRATGNLPVNDGVLLITVQDVAKPNFTVDPSITVKPDEIALRVIDAEGKPVAGASVTFNGEWATDAKPGAQLQHLALTTDAEGVLRRSDCRDKYFYYETIEKTAFAPFYLTDLPLGQCAVVKLQNTARFVGQIGGDRPGKVSLLLQKDKETTRENVGGGDHLIRDIGYQTETDAEGRYNFPMEPGTYRFKAVSADSRFAVGTVTLDENRKVAIPAVLQPGIPITMELTDCQTGQPVPGVEVRVLEQKSAGYFGEREGCTRTSDQQGLIHWDNLMPGRTQLDATHLSNAPTISYSRWWWPDSPDKWLRIDYALRPPTRGEGDQWINIDVKKDLPTIKVQMEKGVKISGIVLGGDGTPQKWATVGVVPVDGMNSTLTGDSRYSIITGDDGKFSGYIPAGNGVVYTLCAYFAPEVNSPSGNTYSSAKWANAVSEPFTSKPGDTFTFQLKMSKGGWVIGKLLGTDGKPVHGMAVTALNDDHMDLAYARRIAAPDKDGNFRLGPLRAGLYTVQSGRAGGTPISIAQPTSENSKQVVITDGQEKDVGTLGISP